MTEPARAFITNLLWEIPSIFGRLVYLASRRDPNSGRYSDPLMGSVFNSETVHQALADLHAETFLAWANFKQSQQKNDLLRYLQAGEGSPRAMVDFWINTRLGAQLVPAGHTEQEFLRNLAVLLLSISVDEAR